MRMFSVTQKMAKAEVFGLFCLCFQLDLFLHFTFFTSLIILSTILIFSSRTIQCNKNRIRKRIKNEAASG